MIRRMQRGDLIQVFQTRPSWWGFIFGVIEQIGPTHFVVRWENGVRRRYKRGSRKAEAIEWHAEPIKCPDTYAAKCSLLELDPAHGRKRRRECQR
jgi:hypothetical protein